MSSSRTLRQAVIAVLIGAFLSQGTWALAGVTGNIAGMIKDSSGAPIAGVQVQAVSASTVHDRYDGCGRSLRVPLA